MIQFGQISIKVRYWEPHIASAKVTNELRTKMDWAKIEFFHVATFYHLHQKFVINMYVLSHPILSCRIILHIMATTNQPILGVCWDYGMPTLIG